jgi:probable HAF family extracellular repeat protein
MAMGINRQGEVVGSSTTSSGQNHAFKWSRATGMVDLGVLPGGLSSYAYAINDSGVVVGNLEVETLGPEQPFRWSPGRGMEVLGTPTGFGGYAGGINADGVVVGGVISLVDLDGQLVVGAVLWKPDSARVDLSMCADCQALAINRAGQVVGAALAPGASGQIVPVRWGKSADMIGLVSTHGYAVAINDLGHAVGSVYDADGKSAGFLWTDAGGLRYLPQPVGLGGHVSIYPKGINSLGQVVGYYNRDH